MNDNLQFQFAMYHPDSDSIEVSVAPGSVLVIRCKEFNTTVTLENPDDIVIYIGWQKNSHLHMLNLH